MKRAIFLSLASASLLLANPIEKVSESIGSFIPEAQDGAGRVINSASNAASEIGTSAGEIGSSIGNIMNGGNIGENLGNIGSAIHNIGSSIGGFVHSVNSNLNRLTKIINDVQDNTIGLCYVTKDVSLDVCALIPKIEVNLDVCTIAPEISGLKKKSNIIGVINNENLGLYCQDREKYSGLGGVGIEEVDVFNKSKEAGKERKPNRKMAGQGGSLQETLKTGSAKNAAFKAFDQAKQEKITRTASNLNKNDSEVTIEDVVATAPKDMNEFEEFVDMSQELLMRQSIDYTPYNFNEKIHGKLRTGSLGPTGAMSEAKKVADLLDAEAGEVYKIKMADVFKKEGFLSLSTKEYVDVLRDDIKIATVQKIDNQIRVASEIKAEVAREYQRKKDLIFLTTQKAVIMNEKFDVQAAKAEVEALIR